MSVSVFLKYIEDSKLEIDFPYFFNLLLELLKVTNWRKQCKRQNNPRTSPSEGIWSTNVRNMSSSYSMYRLFVFVDYAS